MKICQIEIQYLNTPLVSVCNTLYVSHSLTALTPNHVPAWGWFLLAFTVCHTALTLNWHFVLTYCIHTHLQLFLIRMRPTPGLYDVLNLDIVSLCGGCLQIGRATGTCECDFGYGSTTRPLSPTWLYIYLIKFLLLIADCAWGRRASLTLYSTVQNFQPSGPRLYYWLISCVAGWGGSGMGGVGNRTVLPTLVLWHVISSTAASSPTDRNHISIFVISGANQEL